MALFVSGRVFGSLEWNVFFKFLSMSDYQDEGANGEHGTMEGDIFFPIFKVGDVGAIFGAP